MSYVRIGGVIVDPLIAGEEWQPDGLLFHSPDHFAASVLIRKIDADWCVYTARVIKRSAPPGRGGVIDVPTHQQKLKCPGGSSKTKMSPDPIRTWLEEMCEEAEIPLPTDQTLRGILVHVSRKRGDSGNSFHYQYFFLDLWRGPVRTGSFTDMDQDVSMLEWTPFRELMKWAEEGHVRKSHLEAILEGALIVAGKIPDFGIFWSGIELRLQKAVAVNR